MSDHNRRCFMKKGAGAAFVMGATMSVGSTVADEGDDTDIPDPGEIIPEPYASEDWAAPNAGPGHTRHVPDHWEFDPDDLDVAWSFDYGGPTEIGVANHGGHPVIVDGTVYASGENGIFALDENDGSILWERTDLDVAGHACTAAYGSLYFASNDEIVVIDRADGSVEWRHELDGEEDLATPTVAYRAVFIVDGDGTLYALEADDGSVRWERESFSGIRDYEGEDISFTTATVPVSDGRVFATGGEQVVALDVTTGTTLWNVRARRGYLEGANSDAVALASMGDESYDLRDPESGERLGGGQYLRGYTRGLVLSDEIAVSIYGLRIEATNFNGDTEWGLRSSDHDFSSPDAIIGDTVFFSFDEEFDEYGGTLAAVNKHDGEVEWTIENERTLVAFSNGTFYLEGDELVALRELEDEESDDEDEDSEDEEEEADASLSVSVSDPERIPVDGNETFDVTVENASETKTRTSVTVEVGRVCRAIGTEVPAEGSETVRIGVYGGDIGREGEIDWEVTVDGERETGTVTVD